MALFDGGLLLESSCRKKWFNFQQTVFTNSLHMLSLHAPVFLLWLASKFDVSSSASIGTYECHQMMMWHEIIDDFLSLVQIATQKGVALMGTRDCVERASQTLDPFWVMEYKNREWHCQLRQYFSRMYVSYSAAVWTLCCWLVSGESSQTA